MPAFLMSSSFVLNFLFVSLLINYAAGNGRVRQRFGNRYNSNNNNGNRHYGNNGYGHGNFNNQQNQHGHGFNNGRIPFQHNDVTCPRTVFEDAKLEIENCLNNNRNTACQDTSQGIPVNWKGKMVCQRGNYILKYSSFCSNDGNWSPTFLDNCDQMFDLQSSMSSENEHGTNLGHYNQYSQHMTPCRMLQISLSKNFLLTCLTPEHEDESAQQCAGSNGNVPSGTKVFLRCRPPFRNPAGNPEWICENGSWDGAMNKMVCVHDYIDDSLIHSLHEDNFETGFPLPVKTTTENYGWIDTTTNRPRFTTTRPTTTTQRPPPPTTRPTTTTTTVRPVYTTSLAPVILNPVDVRNEMPAVILCPPLSQRPGVLVECIIGGLQVSGTSCTQWNVVGTEASYTCGQYYESSFSLKILYRTCKEDGTWTGSSDTFACIPQCGKSNTILSPRITSGIPTYRSQWPWHASIFLQDKTGVWKYICGGTVLTTKSVISAAHCITLFQTKQARDPQVIRVELGKYKREERDEFVQIKEVKKIEVYESYNPFSYESDIGILILKEEISFGYHVRPACFPQTPDSALEEQQLAKDSVGTVVGFGYDENGNLADELKMAHLRVVSQSECSESDEGGGLSELGSRSTTFCAGFQNATNVCNGDSGGGMVFPLKGEDTTRWYLQGIVSAGISDGGKCNPQKFSVFTRVGRFSSWITRTLSHNDVF